MIAELSYHIYNNNYYYYDDDDNEISFKYLGEKLFCRRHHHQ
jgi:hypothetical protein